MVVFGQEWLYLDKVVLFGPSDCIRENLFYSRKVVELVQKWLYSGKDGLFRVEWLYSRKSGCVRAKLLYSGKNGCIRAK